MPVDFVCQVGLEVARPSADLVGSRALSENLVYSVFGPYARTVAGRCDQRLLVFKTKKPR